MGLSNATSHEFSRRFIAVKGGLVLVSGKADARMPVPWRRIAGQTRARSLINGSLVAYCSEH